ncbi:hypothetical protein FOA43_004411 [Brettanomyces nanus]|uniref:UNC-45/Cro1/She4 central domain-containing protein n=1 Tax=Eeniella nana TaxID=13502 RepID=A0A875S6Q5_EENNA|nr:uncharacterized protein FOA43_004411 [Brettanomyces nanus]QPG77016.1 hypothetical protein FOA43_004411 [Brettanomyces nanus]
MTEIESFKRSLKDDLGKIRKSTNDISATSIPLLKSLLAIIRGNNANLAFKEDISPLLSYILYYICYKETESPALMIIVSLKNSFGEELLGSEVVDTVDDMATTCETRTQRYEVIHVISAVYPVMISACTELFLNNDPVVKLLANEITFLLGSGEDQLTFDGAHHLKQILKLFSSACIDDSCRKLIAKIYFGLLVKTLKMDGSDETKLEAQCIAATVVIKIWSSIPQETFEGQTDILSLNYLSEVLINGLVQNHTKEMVSNSIEGIAFLSLNLQVKQMLRKDDNFLTSLLEKPHVKNRDLAYGILCIVTNLTTYNKVLSKSQQSMESLKSYAQLSKVDPRAGKRRHKITEDNDKDVAKFVSYLLDNEEILERISDALKNAASRGVQTQAIRIIGNLCFKSEHRKEVVKHGGLGIVLSYLIHHSDEVKYNADTFCDIKGNHTIEDPGTRLIALKSVARIIMSHNPNSLFYQKFDIITTAPFLLELVVQYDMDINGTTLETPISSLGNEAVDNSDCFESLIALVNLSSVVNNPQIRELIVKLGWTSIDNLMLCSNFQIQRADLELLSNMMLSPVCSEKFFNWSTTKDRNYRNFEKLCQLTGLADVQSQLAVLNIFANCSDYELIAKMLAESKLFGDKLMEIIKGQDSDEGVILRCFYILMNLLNVSETSSNIYKQITLLKETIIRISVTAKDSEVQQMAKEIVKALN